MHTLRAPVTSPKLVLALHGPIQGDALKSFIERCKNSKAQPPASITTIYCNYLRTHGSTTPKHHTHAIDVLWDKPPTGCTPKLGG